MFFLNLSECSSSVVSDPLLKLESEISALTEKKMQDDKLGLGTSVDTGWAASLLGGDLEKENCDEFSTLGPSPKWYKCKGGATKDQLRACPFNDGVTDRTNTEVFQRQNIESTT